MKRFFYLLTFIILASFHQTSYTHAAPSGHSAYDLGIAKRHNIAECRINEITDDEVFFWTVTEGDSYLFRQVEFYLFDLKTGQETKIPYILTDIFVSDAYYSGKFLYVLYHDSEDRQCIRQVDLKGKVRNDFLLQNTETGQSYYKIYTTDDNSIFATGNVGVAEFDMTGKRVWKVTFSPTVNHARYGGGDKFYSAWSTNLYLMDLGTKKLTGNRITEDFSFADLYAYDGELFIFDESGIRRWDKAQEAASRIVNFADYDIVSGNYAIYVGDDKIRFIDYNPFDKNTAVTLHTINYAAGQSGKVAQGEQAAQDENVALGDKPIRDDASAKAASVKSTKNSNEVLFYLPDYLPFPGEIRDMADSFNSSNSVYKVLFGEYSGRESLDALFSEYGADVVLMADTELINNKGRLLDLAPYMAASELKPENLIPAAKRNYTDGGSMYMIPTEIGIETYAFKASDYSKKTLSPDDFLSYIGKNGTLYTDYFLSKESIMDAIMQVGITEYVDFDAGTCSFDSAAFKKLIDKIDKLTSENYYFPDVDYVNIGKNARILNADRIGSFDFFGKKRAVYGEDVKTVGLPSEGSSAYIMTSLCLAVRSDSECPEGAFKFVEYYFNHFNASDREGTILANRKFYDEAVGELRKSLEVTDFFGTKTKVTEADIDAIEAAVENSAVKDARIEAVIDYENYYTDMYFKGESSLDVAIENLQATVTQYLNR